MTNLLTDQWITADRADGTSEEIAPWQLTSKFVNNPIVSVNAPTEELEASLYEFLIGIYNTVLFPETDFEVENLLENPPRPETLHDQFEQYANQFQVFHKDNPFMQEQSEAMEEVDSAPLHLLPLNGPSENAIKNHRDLHTKANFIEILCGYCAGLLLYSVQTRAVTTNYRYMGTFRDAKNVNTILIEETLWETICSNMTSAERFKDTFGGSSFSDDLSNFSFPWARDLDDFLGNERYGKDQTAYTLEEGHPIEVFWSIPRRFLLEKVEDENTCDFCGESSKPSVTSFRKNTFGLEYEGPWLHPLSPFETNDEGPEHLKFSGVDLVYRNWQSLTYERPEQSTEPALTVQARTQSRTKNIQQLWAYTFNTFGSQNNKIGKFVSGMYPHFTFDKEKQELLFRGTVTEMIKVASEVGIKRIRGALKKAMYGSYSTEKGQFQDVSPPEEWWDNGIFSLLQKKFWSETETRFFSLLERFWNEPDEEKSDSIMINWVKFLQSKGLDIYDELSQRELNTYNRERIFARHLLKMSLSQYNNQIKDIVSLHHTGLEESWNQEQEVKSHDGSI